MLNPVSMPELRAALADPDRDGDDRERLLMRAMRQTLGDMKACGQWDGRDRGRATELLHGAGFTAREVNDFVDDVMLLGSLPSFRSIVAPAAMAVTAAVVLGPSDASAFCLSDDHAFAAGIGGAGLGAVLIIFLLVLLRLAERRRERARRGVDETVIDPSWGGR